MILGTPRFGEGEFQLQIGRGKKPVVAVYNQPKGTILMVTVGLRLRVSVIADH